MHAYISYNERVNGRHGWTINITWSDMVECDSVNLNAPQLHKKASERCAIQMIIGYLMFAHCQSL